MMVAPKAVHWAASMAVSTVDSMVAVTAARMAARMAEQTAAWKVTSWVAQTVAWLAV